MYIQRQFRSVDVVVFTFCSTITLGIIFLPYISEEETRNVWLQLIVTSVPYFFLLWLIHLFSKKYSDYDFFEALRLNLWPIIYWVTMLYLISSTLLGCITMTKALISIVQTYLLPSTPTWIIVLSFYLIVGVAVFYGILAITRFVVLFAFLEIVVLLIIVFLGFSENFNWMYVLPVWNTDLMTFLKSSISNAARYGGIVPLLAFILHVKKDEPIWAAMNIGLGFVMFFYVSISIVVLGTFGFDVSVGLLSPIIALVQTATTRTGMLERMDLFFIAFWLMAFYKILMIHVWFSYAIAHKSWAKLKAPVWIVTFLTLSFVGYMFTPNYIRFSWQIHNINVLVYSLLLPIVLLIYLILRKKEKRS